MTIWPQKNPRRVQLDRAALDRYMAVGWPISGAETGPSRQVLDGIRGFAVDALTFDGEYDVQLAFMHRCRASLIDLLGYQPPDDDEFEIGFLHLMALVDGQTITQESGTRIGEEGKDWDREIDEVSTKLAGRPL
jgi:hypothetical protein